MAASSDNIFTPHQRHVLLIVVLVLLSALVLFGLAGYISAFLGAGILYVTLRPWHQALAHRRGWNRQLVAALLLLFTVVVLVIPFYALSTMLVERLRNIGQYTDQALAVVHRLELRLGYSFASESNVRAALGQVAGRISNWLPTLASSVLNFLVVIGLMLFTLYFLFVQEEAFLRSLRRYLPFRAATLAKLQDALENNVHANVLGQVLISAVQGLLTGLMLAVFGVPDPVFWGAIAFFLAFLPMLGTPLVWGPAALYQFSQGATGQGVGILLVGALVVMNVDNLLRIVLARRIGNIHPLVTLAGVTLGIGVFGILGLVIGPLLLSYLGVLLQVFARENGRNQRKAAARRLTGVTARSLAGHQPGALTPDAGLAVPVLPGG